MIFIHAYSIRGAQPVEWSELTRRKNACLTNLIIHITPELKYMGILYRPL